MSRQQEIRDMVSKAYAKAVREEPAGGCCSGAAEYGEQKREVQSFGCGNPLAFADVKAGETVLDLGSGPGHDLLVAAEAVGPSGRVIGVDMTDEMLEKARSSTREHANIELRKGLIEKLPVEDGSVDWVISNCVINLSPEKDKVFAEIFRVLRPGGRFSISDLVVRDLPEWVREHKVAYAACVAGAISEEEYLAGLRQAGLADVAIDDRFVYGAEQIRGIVESDLKSFEVDVADLMGRLDELVGKVASVRVTGRRPG